MKNFNEYMQDWLNELIDQIIEEKGDSACNILYTQIGGDLESLKKDGGDAADELRDMSDGSEIYRIFVLNSPECIEDMGVDPEEFLGEMFRDTVNELDCKSYSFVPEFIDDMAYHTQDYENPLGFFTDLQKGGCQSGMVSGLIYHDDCIKCYKEHMLSMQSFKEDLEEEIGEYIQPRNGMAYFDFICWLCYEELAFKIGRILFPEDL